MTALSTDAAVAAILNGLPPVEQGHGTERLDLVHLPEEIWTARPLLGQIRQAARSRLVAPDAVLAAVLTRVAACSPHTVELPGIVGSPVGLSFLAGLVGSPEAGKSAASAVAAELLPAPANVLDRLPIGSGEGMVEILFEMVEVEGDDGKTRKEKRQTKHAAIFHVDEGAVLADLGARSGSTLLPTIRTAFTHGTLGNTNASVERRRILDGRAYVYGVTVGIQPALAGPLLADVTAGTPQRFVWARATDPHATVNSPDWPGELDWHPLGPVELEPITHMRSGWKRHQLHVPPTITAEVRSDRVAAQRGEGDRDPGDAHRTLVRLKTAALLALLDHRLGLDEDDWHLAGIIVDTSRRVRQGVEDVLTYVEQRKEHTATERLTRRELHLEDSKEARALSSASRSVGRLVVRHQGAGHHSDPDGCTRNCLTKAMASQHRTLVTTDDVIAEAERNGWITQRDDRWIPGESRPA